MKPRFLTTEKGRFQIEMEVVLPEARLPSGETSPTVKLINEAQKKINTHYLREIDKEHEGNRIVRYAIVLLREKDGQR